MVHQSQGIYSDRQDTSRQVSSRKHGLSIWIQLDLEGFLRLLQTKREEKD